VARAQAARSDPGGVAEREGKPGRHLHRPVETEPRQQGEAHDQGAADAAQGIGGGEVADPASGPVRLRHQQPDREREGRPHEGGRWEQEDDVDPEPRAEAAPRLRREQHEGEYHEPGEELQGSEGEAARAHAIEARRDERAAQHDAREDHGEHQGAGVDRGRYEEGQVARPEHLRAQGDEAGAEGESRHGAPPSRRSGQRVRRGHARDLRHGGCQGGDRQAHPQVEDHAHPDGAAHAEFRHQHQSGQETARHRAEGVETVEPADRARDVLLARHVVAAEEKEGSSHQDGRRQQGQRDQSHPGQQVSRAARARRAIDLAIEGVDQLEQPRTRQGETGESQFQRGEPAQRSRGAMGEAAEPRASHGHAEKEDGEHRAQGEGGRAEDQRGRADPADLVDESRESGEEEGNDDDRVSQGVADCTRIRPRGAASRARPGPRLVNPRRLVKLSGVSAPTQVITASGAAPDAEGGSVPGRVVHYARPYALRYALGFALLLVTNGLSLWIPWLLRDAIRALERQVDLRVIGRYALLMMGVALVQAGVRTLSRLSVLGTSRRIVYDIRNLFFAHLQRLGSSFYDTHRTGDIMSRGVNDVRLVQALYGPGALNLMNTAIVYVGVLVLLLRVDVTLTLLSLLLYPALFFVVNRLSRRIYARSLAVQEQLASISSRAQENISGIQQVKIFAQEDRETAAFRDLCAEYRRRNLSMAALRGGMLSMIGALAGMSTLIVLFVGGRFVIQGRIDFGDFVAFNAYLALLVWPTIALGWIINTIQRGAGAMRRLEEIFAEEPEVADASLEAAAGEESLDGEIEIRGLTFAYPVADREAGRAPRPALVDLDLKIPRGSRVALVGPVGSGKSTLANLLARLYPVPAGTIFIGGVDLNHIPLSRLRSAIGYVPQEAFLFSRSLRENIALGHPGATDEEVARAVDRAGLAEDLESFPGGLDTLVGERGYTLSGGQRQRATLARALLGRPDLLILDDSLSSVDADTERTILEALHDRTRERTLILISHRLSTLAGVDRIVVLDRGRIVEQGGHDELMAEGGLYAALFRRHLLEQRLGG